MGKRRGQGGVGLVYSVFLTALLTGCPGGDEASSVVGTWQGRTSQGKNISFVVALDETITTVTVGAHITGNACTFDDDALRASTSDFTEAPPRIVGNQFSVSVSYAVITIFPPPMAIANFVMTGTFANESTVAGALQFTAACDGRATATFQAMKQ